MRQLGAACTLESETNVGLRKTPRTSQVIRDLVVKLLLWRSAWIPLHWEERYFVCKVHGGNCSFINVRREQSNFSRDPCTFLMPNGSRLLITSNEKLGLLGITYNITRTSRCQTSKFSVAVLTRNLQGL